MGSADKLPIDPDYPISESYDDGMLRSRSLGGTPFLRRVAPARRSFHLIFSSRPTSDKQSLMSFYRETENTYFVLEIPVYIVSEGAYVTRCFPVHWVSAPKCDLSGYEQWFIESDVIEAPGCALATNDYPDPDDGHPTATIIGTVSGADKIFIYSGYGFTYTGTGTLALDGVSVTSPKLNVPLGLHRLVVVGYGGAATLEAVI